MEQYYIYLFTGLGLMALLLVIFNVGFAFDLFDNRGPPPIFMEDKVRTTSFTIDASNLREEQTKDLGTVKVHDGLIFGNNDYAYSLNTEEVDDLEIIMNVKSTNGYGKLAVKANDNVLMNDKLLLGEYTIPVSRDLYNGHVVVELDSESSWWRIWAPNLYEVDLALNYDSFAEIKDEYRFTLGDEFENLDAVTVNFIFPDNVGAMSIDVNGNQTFSGHLGSLEQIEIDTDLFKQGENVMTFTPAPDAFYSGSAIMAISYQEQVVIE